MLYGNRIPIEYFATDGVGESDTSPVNAFDKALKDGQISNVNIMTYSSILPKEARKIDQIPLPHGCVVETIMARADGRKYERISAGIGCGHLHKKSDGEYIGGIVVEYHGNLPDGLIDAELRERLQEMVVDRSDSHELELREIETYHRALEPTKDHGSVIVALCFTSYEFPEKK